MKYIFGKVMDNLSQSNFAQLWNQCCQKTDTMPPVPSKVNFCCEDGIINLSV